MTAVDKKDIRDLSFEELAAELKKWGRPAYRAGQIFDWVYKKGAASFSSCTDLPLSLRQRLGEEFSLSPLVLADRVRSRDGTEKFLFELVDGNFVETVLIPAGRRKTLCLSTQVGCRFGCAFCASGMGGFRRNLTPAEILGQILFLRDSLSVDLTNLVFMGMGEPLDNYENVVRAVRTMNDRRGLGIAARRITISTAGVVPGLERLKNLGLQLNVSLSLHALRDDLRSELMPINKKYPLADVLRAAEGYFERTGRMITLEYILLRDVNDSAEDARLLAAAARRLKAKVNLIPYSQACGPGFEAPAREKAELFLKRLEDRGVRATLRRSKGADIQAACGQLAGRLRRRARPKT
jgi:23S rRNA (adenine2503-C2)-methyltransferase